MRETRNVRTYDRVFREDALAFLERSKDTLAEVAVSLGIPTATLYNWYRQDMSKKAKKTEGGRKRSLTGTAETDADKLARLEGENETLRKRVATLKEDKDILKKFAAFPGPRDAKSDV